MYRVVLVPPLFERDHRGRSRMANSSYDFLFAKPALKWLFHDYIDNNAHALLRLSPGEDPRVSITARFDSSLRSTKYRKVIVAEQNSGAVLSFKACAWFGTGYELVFQNAHACDQLSAPSYG